MRVPRAILLVLLVVPASGAALEILEARSTSRFLTTKAGRFQAIMITVENTGGEWITRDQPACIRVEGEGVITAAPALIKALAPDERTRVEVGVDSTLAPGVETPVRVIATLKGRQTATLQTVLTAGVTDYLPEVESLASHESPSWFNNAKFGIFINWGVYSVPAWAPVGKDYAEWYWDAMNRKGMPTYEHHLQTYGSERSYDDFIPELTGAGLNPKAWIELIQASKARYFVLDSKHHDGFALFDTATTGRNSVAMGPRRDVVREVFDAARIYAPELKRGLYYSLFEWYHPAYTGRLPSNPYTGALLPYTGAAPIVDFVADHVLPQMREIVGKYDPDILWCDGAWEQTVEYWHTAEVIARYFNQAIHRERPKDVVVNNRCRVTDPDQSAAAGDFTTPEYETFSTIVARKWESNRGLDPFSYGYNQATADSEYMTAKQIVDTLVDIVSKNGNLLLNIGPAADGSIPAVMQNRLREIGDWLTINGEAIFDTAYWWRTPEEGALRFTVKPGEAFYIIALDWPGAQLTVSSPVPIASGHTITLLGYDGTLAWSRSGGHLLVDIPQDAKAAGRHAWVFKITW